MYSWVSPEWNDESELMEETNSSATPTIQAFHLSKVNQGKTVARYGYRLGA
jgi:hypothetical protein